MSRSVVMDVGAVKFKDSQGHNKSLNVLLDTTRQKAVTEITNLSNTEQATITQKGTAAVQAIEAKGQSTLASIPADYTTLGNEVSEVKEDISEYVNVYTSPSNIPYGKTITIDLDKISTLDGYKKMDGSVVSEYHHIKIPCYGIKKISMTQTSSSGGWIPYVIFEDVDGNLTEGIKGNTSYGVTASYKFYIPTDGYIYINRFASEYPHLFDIEYYSKESLTLESKKDNEIYNRILSSNEYHLSFNDLTEPISCYMNPSNGELVKNSSNHRLVHLPFQNISRIKCDTPVSNYPSMAMYIVYNNDNIVKTDTPSSSNRYLDLTEIEYTDIYINWWDSNTYINGITLFMNQPKKYSHCVQKPFDFNGKKAVFTGDSATKGYVNGTTIIDNGYPKLFSERVGMTFENIAVGGASISRVAGYGCIQDQITNADKTADYIFIAGGMNDWQLGVNLSDFRSAMQSVMTYLNNNYGGNIIFITPINHGGWTPIKTPVATVQDYRDIVTRVALSNNVNGNVSVVQGDLLGFPSESDNTNYISIMYGDKIHPTELGYKTIYLNGLLTALC